MCGRYSFPTKEENARFENVLSSLRGRSLEVKTGDVNPGDIAAVIAKSRRSTAMPFAMRWGYHLPDGKLIFNTRSETAAVKPMFADGIAQRRCLVPAVLYYEWEKTGSGKKKYSLAPENTDGFYLAGIYRYEGDNAVFSVLTQTPAPEIAFIHDRMPVIIPEALASDWLDPAKNAEQMIASINSSMIFREC